ncbi:MAG TPA: C4-dicarboxylate transporter DctA [Polyangiaceae bacterium]
MPSASQAPRSRRLPGLYVQVLIAVFLAIVLGVLRPTWGIALKPLGDLFVNLIKVMIAPIVFCTVAIGIAKMQDLKAAGRVGGKALLWFELSTTLALGLGLLVGHVLHPGSGIHAALDKLDQGALDRKLAGPVPHGFWEHVLGVVPETFFAAFAHGEILQVLLLALLTGIALARLGPRAAPLVDWLEQVSQLTFGIVELVMHVAPIGAFGAMAFTVGKYGVGTLGSLLELVLAFYATAVLFVLLVLGVALHFAGLSIWRLLVYLREELLIVLGTSSSESVLPRLMDKLERAGCRREVVHLVVPTGYSFNLDGTAIYLTLASLFIAQALDVPLRPGEELSLLAVLLLTSKGAAAVTGGGFVTLAATLSATHSLPVLGLTLLLGVDRFMSEARALTNLVGNAVGTLLVARWEKALDLELARRVLRGTPAGDSSRSRSERAR